MRLEGAAEEVLALDVSLRYDSGFDLDVSLTAGPEPLVLAGPSGAGKSTILRLVAGLARPQRGTIHCGGAVWSDAAGAFLAPERRRCGYVPQDHALFPHLRAWQNVAFGAQGTRRERRTLAMDLLERFGLSPQADARPGELSGGESQRVALARALAGRPRLLALDEPLSALDPGTRLRAGRELSAILAAERVPALLVTHDFAEAAALAGDIAVLERGRLVQRGSPQRLAAAPASAFVADFTGASVLTGTACEGPGGLTRVWLDGGGELLSTDSLRGQVIASIHPWEVSLEPSGGGTGANAGARGSAQNRLAARVTAVVPLGSRVRVSLETPQFLTAEVTAPATSALGLVAGAEVLASFKATATRLAAR